MKRGLNVVVCLFLILSFCVLSSAQETQEKKEGEAAPPAMVGGMGQGMKEGRGMMGGMMGRGQMMEGCPMQGMMKMKMMMEKSVVATSDGGVVIVMGNKILKYDKNLNLVKEAEIKVDMEAMHKAMKEMKGKGSMHHEMMEKKSAKPESAGAQTQESSASEADPVSQ